MLTDKNQKNLILIEGLVKDLKIETGKILAKFPTETYTLDKFYLIGIIERYRVNLEAIEILLPYIKTKFHLEHAIGLILRNSIHDTINVFYLSAKCLSKDFSNQTLHDEILVLCADQMSSTVTYVESLKGNNLVDQVKVESALTDFPNNFPSFFSEEDKSSLKMKLKIKDFPSVTKKINVIKSSSFDKLKESSLIYDIYQLYSKYEHFGIITHNLQRRDPNEIVTNIYSSIQYVIQGILNTLILLTDEQDDFQVEKKRMIEFESIISEI